MKTSRRIAGVLASCSLLSIAMEADAAQLCSGRRGRVFMREACRRSEHAIATDELLSTQGPPGEVGSPGPSGPQGPQGAIGEGLSVVDALGRTVGRVTSLETPGEFGASVFRKIGDDWLLLQVDRHGLLGPDRGVYSATADCSGPMYFDVSDEFGRLASPVSIDPEGRGYFARYPEVLGPPEAYRVEVFVDSWSSCGDYCGQPASEEALRPIFCAASSWCGEGTTGPPPLNGTTPWPERDVLTCCTPASVGRLLAPVQVIDPAVLAVSPPLRLR